MNKATIDLTVWQNRWRGMDAAMTDWLQRTAGNQPGFDRQETLTSLLAGLQAFGASQMNFFLRGLSPSPQYRLEPSAEYPWEYVFRTTIDQIGFDLDVIQRAAHQRVPAISSSAMRKTLDLADRLAYRALQPALEGGLIDHATTVVTYFQKSISVRLTPYAPVVLVGIPYNAIDHPRDLLAIPHEVGHYVFREGRVREGRFADSRFAAALYSRFAHRPAWYNQWLEEIFADMYGCLIAGPVIGLSFIELVTDDPLEDFLKQDGEHPVDAVRPQIYFRVLERMGRFPHAVSKLRAHWHPLFVERGNPQALSLPGVEQPLSMDAIASEMDEQIIAVLAQPDFLGKLLATAATPGQALWSDELDTTQTVEGLIKAFMAYCADVTPENTPLPELRRKGDETLIMETPATARSGATAVSTQKLGATGLWIDAIKEAASRAAERKDPVFAVPPEIWSVLLDAGGWATEGPGGGNPHK